jgi:hypothetical protein
VSDKLSGVLNPQTEGAPVTDDKHTDRPMARTVIMLPDEGRAALRAAALDEGVDMGEFVFEVLKSDSRYREALERIRRKKGRDRKKDGGDK